MNIEYVLSYMSKLVGSWASCIGDIETSLIERLLQHFGLSEKKIELAHFNAPGSAKICYHHRFIVEGFTTAVLRFSGDFDSFRNL